MSIYLNTKRPLENFKELYGDKYFVDKSELISILNKKISTHRRKVEQGHPYWICNIGAVANRRRNLKSIKTNSG